jgi:hypothetical protein
MLSPNEARQQLSEACQDSDAARVSQLFASRSLNVDDATKALGTLINSDPTLVRVLLENGADASVVPIRKIASSKCGNEPPRLFARYNYDLQSEGHLILQSVSVPVPRKEEQIDFPKETLLTIERRSTGCSTKQYMLTVQTAIDATMGPLFHSERRTIRYICSTT